METPRIALRVPHTVQVSLPHKTAVTSCMDKDDGVFIGVIIQPILGSYLEEALER
jgi:hypothetical protein